MEKIDNVLRILAKKLVGINYTLIGSVNLMLQGVEGFEPADIDLLTTPKELQKIDKALKPWQTKEIYYDENNGRNLTPWTEVLTWQDGTYRQANHLFPKFFQNYRELITQYDSALAQVKFDQSYRLYQSVIECLRRKAELNLKGIFADGRECISQ